MVRALINPGQALTSDDLNKGASLLQKGLLETLGSHMGISGFRGDSFLVTRNDNNSILVKAGIHIPRSGSVANPSDTTNESTTQIAQKDESSTQIALTAAHATLPRRDLVMIRPKLIDDTTTEARDIKDAVTGVVASTSVSVRKKWSYEISIKVGTAAASPSTPSKTSGWERLAVLLITPAVGLAAATDVIDLRYPVRSPFATYAASGAAVDYYNSIGNIQSAGLIQPAIAASGATLVISKAAPGGTTWANTMSDALWGGMWWEMREALAGGYALTFYDGGSTYDNQWILVPDVPSYYTPTAAFASNFVMAGGITSNRTLTITKPTDWKIFKSIALGNGEIGWQPRADFTGFVTNSFTQVWSIGFGVYGIPSLTPSFHMPLGNGFPGWGGLSANVPLRKNYVFRPLVGANAPAWPSASDIALEHFYFEMGKRIRVTLNLPLVYAASGQDVRLQIWNGTSAGRLVFDKTIRTQGDFNAQFYDIFEYINDVSSNNLLTFRITNSAAAAGTQKVTTGNTALTYYTTWGQFPWVRIEEVQF